MSEQIIGSFADMEPAPPAERFRLWTLRGRLGRVQYIVASLVALVLASLCLSMIGFAILLVGGFGRMMLGMLSVLLVYGLLPILFAVLTVRRAHDFNRGGWVAIFLLVPVLNLLFWIIPGSRGENDYGPASPQPTVGMKVLAVLLPLLLIGGFVATPPFQGSGKDDRPAKESVNPIKPYQP